MSFRIVSSAFKDNDYIPHWYSRSNGDSSPPIGWTKPPGKTVCLALIVTCTDSNTGKVFCHWVVFNIPPRPNTIYGNRPHKKVSNDGIIQGVNGFRRIGWGGPADDIPDQELLFKLYALNTRLDLPGRVSYHVVKDAIEGHILEETSLTGRYTSH